jgi:hypothetical protein
MAPEVEYAEIGLPPPEVTASLPTIATEEYERRMAAVVAAVPADRVVVYGDREHVGNIAFLCGFDPRFEEALLVLGGPRPRLIVGTEGMGHSRYAPVDLDRVWVPTLSLMGIDRGAGLTLAEAFAYCGISRGSRVGLVGWKALERTESRGSVPAIAAPAFIVDELRETCGGPDRVVDATSAMMGLPGGLRLQNTADQLAFFEWGASRSSVATFEIIRAARPGMTESEMASAVTYRGVPFSYHPILTSGPEIPNGLRSPSGRVVQLGDAIFATVGMWGGNCGRGGILARGEADCSPDNAESLDAYAIPYWRAVVAWWESVRIGVTGGEIHDRLTELCVTQGFRPALGTGHLMDWEDWPNTPFRHGSTDAICSGMLMAADIFADTNGPQRIFHCEDTLAVADDGLRAELAERHPSMWERVSARQRFMRERLGIQVADELLPFVVAPAYLPIFWLEPDRALRVRAG